MKAIVCDKCGKVRLLDEVSNEKYPDEFAQLSEPGKWTTIDLCAKCYADLIAALRGGEGK